MDLGRPAYRIETERLVLRCWAPEDAPALRQAIDISAAELRPWIPFMAEEPRTLEQTADWLRTLRAAFDLGQSFRYGVWGGPDRLLGENMLLARAGPGALEIGYWTVTGSGGRGYASEATRALIRVAFEAHGVDRVEIHCAPQNQASAAIPAKLEFTHEATLRRRATNLAGERYDLMVWTLLRDEYHAQAGPPLPLVAFDALGQRLI